MHIHSPVFSGSITQANSAYVQLSGSLTGSFSGDGSSLTNLPVPDAAISGATAALNVLTFTRGDGSTFTATIDTGSGGGGGVSNYESLSNIPSGIVSSSTQLTSLGFVTNALTASQLITASATLNRITFTKGDGSTFGLTIHTGSGGGGGGVSNYEGLSNIPEGIISSSAQIDALFNIDGLVSSSTQVVDHLPAGTVSSSAQTIANVSGSHIHVAAITASSFVSTATGTPTLRAANNLILSASNSVQINGGTLRLPSFTDAQTGSLTLADGDLIYNSDRDKVLFYSGAAFNEFGTGTGGGVSAYADLTGIPSGIVSSSTQLGGSTLENIILTGSTGISGSLIPEDDGSGNGIHDLGSVSHPFRDLYLTTSSINFVQDGELFVSLNAQTNAIRVGNILITTSSIGAIDNSDNSVINVIETSNMGMTASLTVPYDGDRTVTNTNAGDWHGTNIGTSGSIVDFLDALFFPNTPPSFTLAANQSIDEYTASGSTAFTVTATDADNDAITFSSPLYTGSFLQIASNGVVTMRSESSATDHNINDRGDGTLAYPFPVRASDPN
jgi:hypothetical protein